ncbi:uncharacterized protein [Leptinotarsa decemlineata]|uniref:uncharacterized protein n=1 Tax=Leptinotarsa decemlineata TaxID=7539 RepID=UPI000C254D56|nr:uncharacterized protein LOC111515154 [Leptinotarsa decemlineata]
MTILHSCCCWRSVRKGSYACGIYTAFYYTMNAAHSSFLLHEELTFFRNSSEAEDSLIDHDTTSETSMAFTIVLLTLSSMGIFTTFLLLFGLYKDCKILLIPWIFNIIIFILADMSYVIYSLIVHALQWNPTAAIIITIDFFLNSLHVYSLLCVISQYQELKAGRGRTLDDQLYRVPNVHYSSQPTATSFMSSRKPVTYYETKPTPTQSPTGPAPSPSIIIPDILSPNIGSTRRGSRKSVKFGDSNTLPHHNGSQLLDPWSIESKSPILVKRVMDTAPLINSGGVNVTQLSV